MEIAYEQLNAQQDAPPVPRRCKHCNAALAKSRAVFCCSGCEFVHETLTKLGLSSFYRMKAGDTSVVPATSCSPKADYGYLDDPELQARLLAELPDGRCQVKFYLPTIHCAACVWLLERLPQFISGVEHARVHFGAGKLEIVYRPAKLALSQLAGILNSIGYPPVPYTADEIEEQDRREERQMLRRIGVAALCAANTMMLAVSLFQGYFTGIEEPYNSLFRWLSGALALPAVMYSAVPFYRTAVGSLFSGALHIDLPISIAIIGATIAGFISLSSGAEYLYFDSVTALIFLLLLGRFIQRRAIHRARASTKTAWDLFPAMARCLYEGRVFEKPLRELREGDIVEVWANERVPSDGIVIDGSSSLETAFLTGEHAPLPVAPGDSVLGGSLNIDGKLTLRITSVGANTRLGKILHVLESAQDTRAPIENQVNRLSSYFTFGVLCLAAGTYGIWSFIDPSRAFDCAVAVLIVTCPCALGIAIPAAVTVAMARAQQAKLYIKRSDALETLAAAEHFYFDKTGTLTEGKLRVSDADISPNDLSAAFALASCSANHPAALAVLEGFPAVAPAALTDLRVVPGNGIVGSHAGTTCRLGSLRWFRDEQIAMSAKLQEAIRQAARNGASVLGFARNREATGYLILQDTVRPEAAELVKRLLQLDKRVFVLSGDSHQAVQSIATELGLPGENAFGELLPAQKAEIVRNDTAVSAFIGDGMNDALALKAGSVGIGLRGGLEATLECADVFVAEGGLKGFQRLYDGALLTRKTIRRNLSFAAAYNILGAAAAVFGWVNPLAAAVLMPASSLTVIVSSVTTKYFREGSWK